ncbi:MAG: hypothetical protein K2F81_05525 [Ruminococcus sp.]|nr:hypothetical protein [Ruminococcus sp.]
MSTEKNIFIPRSIAADNVDAFVKTGSAEIELRNGDIVSVGEKINGVYKLTVPTDDTKKFGIVYNSDAPIVNGHRVGNDPRDIVFPANKTVNFFIPKVGDEVAVTVVAGTEKSATHLNPTASDTVLTYATSQAPSGLSLEITGTSFVSVGSERIKTIEAVVVAE